MVSEFLCLVFVQSNKFFGLIIIFYCQVYFNYEIYQMGLELYERFFGFDNFDLKLNVNCKY